MSQSNSFQELMTRLRASEEQAAAQIFNRFAQRLIVLARSHLDTLTRGKVDPEDVLQSVFRCFFTRQAAGHWELHNWESLWGLLIVITARKCGQWNQHFLRGCRNVHLEVSAPASDGSSPRWEAASPDPTPEEGALLAETVQRVMEGLKERERPILMLSLQGYSIREIAEQIGRTERTVRRVRERIEQRLEHLRDTDAQQP